MQHYCQDSLFEIEIFSNIINVFVNSDQFNAFLLNNNALILLNFNALKTLMHLSDVSLPG